MMNNADTRTAALYMVDNERNRQDEKWGQQDHEPSKWVHILGEEFGEYCEAVNETVFNNGPQAKLKGGYDNMLKELTHIAAVAVGAMECLMRSEESADAKKIKALNSLDIVDYSCSGGTCEYVTTDVTAENIKILLDAGFTAEQIDEAIGDNDSPIDLSILAFQHLNAMWWGTETGFTQESYEPQLSESPGDEQSCRICGCTQNNACPGGCYWVEDDLCSKCAGGKAEMKYKCIQSFSVEKHDDDGFLIDNEYHEVESGSLWETDNSINVIGGEVRLIALSENHFEWLEISRETLNLHFELYKEDETIAGAQP